jgi:hypothetical protein
MTEPATIGPATTGPATTGPATTGPGAPRSSVPEVRAAETAASAAPPPGASPPELDAADISAPGMPLSDAPAAPPAARSVPEVPPPNLSEPHASASATTTQDAPATMQDAPPTRPDVPPPPASHGLAWLVAAAIVVLAASQAALWVRVLMPSSAPAPLDQRVQDQRVQAIEARVTALERRPPPVAPAQPGPAAAPGANGPAPDLGPLEARIAALEQRPPPVAVPNPNDSLAPRLTADEARLATLEKSAEVPAQLADRANRIARVQAAFIALSVGHPLGDVPGTPPALARYAATAPPTEAALRLSFPALAQAALAADHPAPGEKPFLQRVWAEAQDLITIRQGEHVLVGNPAAGILAHAQTALDAGDLAGAVASLDTLSGPAAQALAAWLDQAHGLLAARAALAELAAQT